MKVIAVFKTHVDIGFTDLPHKVLAAYSGAMLTRIVEACENTANTLQPLKWTMPAFVLHHALRNCTEDLKKRVEALILRDQIVWHALPFTLKTEFFSGYELRQTLYYAKELCRIYKKPMPISAKMTDVPGHTQALVDVLSENGIKFLHLGCNPASTPPAVPRLFFWESKGGNRILTYYDKDYGSHVIPPHDWKYPVYLSMNVSGDNSGVHSDGILEQLKLELHSYDPEAELCTGTMDDFARELMKHDLSDLPVIRGELGDTWIAGLGAFPEGCAAIGDVRRTFERISLFLEAKKDHSFEALQRRYLENAMLFGEHSGGVDVKRLLSDRRQYQKSELIKALKTEQYLYANSGWDDERTWCYAAREAALQLQKSVEEKYGKVLLAKNESVPDSKRYSFACIADQLVITDHQKHRDVKISYIYEIIGRETIDTYLDTYLTKKCDWSLADFGRYQLDGTNTYPDVQDKTFTACMKSVFQSSNALSVTYYTTDESFTDYGNAEEVTIRAANEGSRVLISVDIKNKQPTMFVEAGYLCFDFGEKIKKLTICKSGVEINPQKDIISGANSALFAVDKFVKVNDFCIEPVHTPLVCFERPKIYRKNIDAFRLPSNGVTLFNLFNNMWASGSPQWVSGSYHFEYYLD